MEKPNKPAVVPGLLHPYTDKDFFSKYFEIQPLHISRNQSGYFDSILSIEDIDDYLAAAHISYPDVNMASASDASSPSSWLPMPQAGKKLDVVKDEVLKGLANGDTLIVNLLEQKIPKLNKFLCRQAEEWMVELTANAYITPPSQQGFEWHYDDHDVLVLQIKGSKNWEILPDTPFLPDQNFKSRYSKLKNDDGAQSYVLQEGDSLYIPRGIYHKAKSQDHTSVHLTLAINTTKNYNLFRGLLKAAIAKQSFRKSILPKYQDSAELEAQLEAMKEFSSNYFDQLLSKQNELNTSIPQPNQVNQHGRLKSVLLLDKLSTESVLSSRTIDFEHRQNGGFIVIRSQGKSLRLPLVAEKLLLALLNSRKLHFHQLPSTGLSEKQRLDITRKLIAEGWIDIEVE